MLGVEKIKQCWHGKSYEKKEPLFHKPVQSQIHRCDATLHHVNRELEREACFPWLLQLEFVACPRGKL